MNVIIVDSIMGSGKSTWAFNYINTNPDRKYLYVTPFIDECSRAIKACNSIGMVQPKEKPTKQADFMRLVKEGKNIATTHSLFCQLSLSQQDIDRIRDKGYILIIDEVFETVQPFDKLTKQDLQFLCKNGYIAISTDGTVLPSKEKALSDWEGTQYEEVLPYIKAHSLVSFDGKLLLRVFPVETLTLSQEIYVLTYLFDASHLKHTLDMNNYEYNIRWINAAGELTDEYQDYRELKQQYKELIHIYQGKMNKVGETNHALSASKWKEKYSDAEKKKIANHARTFFTYSALSGIIAPAEACLWAVYGEKKKEMNDANYNETRKVNVTGYSMSCIPFNERATNQYRDRYVLAYLVNVYEHLGTMKWFESKGITCDHDLFALSTMLQWIWRSRIRDGGDIYLYMPSKRMRNLLEEWLDGKR